jgi:hypothetical protein
MVASSEKKLHPNLTPKKQIKHNFTESQNSVNVNVMRSNQGCIESQVAWKVSAVGLKLHHPRNFFYLW